MGRSLHSERMTGMNSMQKEIQRQLNARLLSDWCDQRGEEHPGFAHAHGYDSNGRVIRFSTERTRSLLSLSTPLDGYWKNGHAMMYEIVNEPGQLLLRCAASSSGLKKHDKAKLAVLIENCCATECAKDLYALAQWPIDGKDINEALEALNDVYEIDVMWFESELLRWQEDAAHSIRSFPCDDRQLIPNTDLPEEIYIEGAQKQILLNQYERNPKARAKCIALKGTACCVCGFDFGKAYGEAFAGKIEVHHITPISEIGETYVVDPVKDLVPVCPNCHMMLHSKQEGVYLIEELASMLKAKRDS